MPRIEYDDDDDSDEDAGLDGGGRLSVNFCCVNIFRHY